MKTEKENLRIEYNKNILLKDEKLRKQTEQIVEIGEEIKQLKEQLQKQFLQKTDRRHRKNKSRSPEVAGQLKSVP